MTHDAPKLKIYVVNVTGQVHHGHWMSACCGRHGTGPWWVRRIPYNAGCNHLIHVSRTKAETLSSSCIPREGAYPFAWLTHSLPHIHAPHAYAFRTPLQSVVVEGYVSNTDEKLMKIVISTTSLTTT